MGIFLCEESSELHMQPLVFWTLYAGCCCSNSWRNAAKCSIIQIRK
ncbi:hypothetical protein SELSPUOL_00963 [Selenomonas sputigena ATCC 35185]|uniref:Uncharacterized protein n=1 Tax=Selenomonas sputigena (strain ATCC 35185 / DSM 20758 / CCUG 44933 / VPI D19B-28) TaxID=546271 RepID=C9LUF6_SELS3|nr:hypothetical protein SELSPUOL_00963 [Selenomonas sputigena ATCC 35185]